MRFAAPLLALAAAVAAAAQQQQPSVPRAPPPRLPKAGPTNVSYVHLIFSNHLVRGVERCGARVGPRRARHAVRVRARRRCAAAGPAQAGLAHDQAPAGGRSLLDAPQPLPHSASARAGQLARGRAPPECPILTPARPPFPTTPRTSALAGRTATLRSPPTSMSSIDTLTNSFRPLSPWRPLYGSGTGEQRGLGGGCGWGGVGAGPRARLGARADAFPSSPGRSITPT